MKKLLIAALFKILPAKMLYFTSRKSIIKSDAYFGLMEKDTLVESKIHGKVK